MTAQGETMYKKILIPLDNSKTDEAILKHIRLLARTTAAELILIHVADGYVARLQQQLNLEDSEEIQEDRRYIQQQKELLTREGFKVRACLACGDPVKEILEVVQKEGCDLIAMATHGHRLLGDILFGSVAENLRHRTGIPILMIKAPKG